MTIGRVDSNLQKYIVIINLMNVWLHLMQKLIALQATKVLHEHMHDKV
jgi:hypothetical protein